MVVKLLKRVALDDGYAYSSPHTALIKAFEKQLKYPVGVGHTYKIWLCLKENYPELKNYRSLALGIYAKYGSELLEVASYWRYTLYRKNKITKGLRPGSILPRSMALIEQKARGFIHRNDMLGYDEGYSHIISNINPNYIIPINIPRGWPDKGSKVPEIHRGQYLYGVAGYTKVEYAKY